jgi:predicted O-methyltransferase YrrM
MTKIMKIKPLAQACAFILATGSLIGVSGIAMAAPTPADTLITNKVIVTYQDASGKICNFS